MDEFTALVIIDMQKYFYHRGLEGRYITPEQMKESWIETVKHINEQIRQAKKRNIPILVVEFDSNSMDNENWKTDGRICRTIGSYPYVKYVKKDYDDGSERIERTLENTDWVVKNFRICGANRVACVAATVKGLAKRYKDAKIHLVKKAITDEGGERGRRGADRLPNVVMV